MSSPLLLVSIAQAAPSPSPSPLLIGLLICAGVVAPIFWLWMLLDCLQSSSGSTDYHFSSTGLQHSKSNWIRIILGTGFFGALLYFFHVRRPRLARRRARRAEAGDHAHGRQAPSPPSPR